MQSLLPFFNFEINSKEAVTFQVISTCLFIWRSFTTLSKTLGKPELCVCIYTFLIIQEQYIKVYMDETL